MRKFIYTITALSTLLWSCGGGGGDTPTPTPPITNNAPSIPTLAYPTDNLLCFDNVLTFSWSSSTDPDVGDVITYHIQIAKSNQFSPVEQEFNVSGTTKTATLDIGTAYYWRVQATDNKSAKSSYSTAIKFYTEGVGITNHVPFAPELVSPSLNAIVAGAPTTATLQWIASDVDVPDVLTFDVYFDTVNPPVAVYQNQVATSFDVDLAASTPYYWKVVVKDGKGGEAVGQVWNFVTD